MMEYKIQEIWSRLETQLYLLAPEVAQSLEPRASEDLIERTEKQLHITLSDELKSLYRLHNGARNRKEEGIHSAFLVDALYFHPLEQVCDIWRCAILANIYSQEEAWEDLRQAFPGERYQHDPSSSPYHILPPYRIPQEALAAFTLSHFPPWGCHPQWFPFMSSPSQMYYLLDLLPEHGGRVLSATDVYSREASLAIIAPSLQHFCLKLAEELERGLYHFDEATGMLWSHEGLASVDQGLLDHWRWERRQQLR